MFDSYIALVNKVRLEMHLTFVEIAHSAAARSLIWTSQGHTASVHQSPQGPPLLLLVAISSAEGFSDLCERWTGIPFPKTFSCSLCISLWHFRLAEGVLPLLHVITSCPRGGDFLLLLSKLVLLVGHWNLSLVAFKVWCRSNWCYSLLIVQFCFTLMAFIFCEMMSVSL